jgi:SnoaL-like protein
MPQLPIGAAIAAAVAQRDRDRLAAAFTDTARLRALLPGGPVESHGRDAVVARFAGWFDDFDTVEVVSAADEPVADRLLVHYRLTLRQGPRRWACTQTLIAKTVGEQLATLDLLCSGFRQVGEEADDDG